MSCNLLNSIFLAIILLLLYPNKTIGFISPSLRPSPFFSLSPWLLPRKTSNARSALFSLSFIDISQDQDSSIRKATLKRGHADKGVPRAGDTVEIRWKLWLSNGTLVHEQKGAVSDGSHTGKFYHFFDAFDTPHRLEIDEFNDDSPVGWHLGVKTMFEGEVARFHIKSHLGFGMEGFPGKVPPNEDLIWEVELMFIAYSMYRKYGSDPVRDNYVQEELLEKIYNNESPLSYEAMINKHMLPNRTNEERKFYNETAHRLDPDRMITGEHSHFRWEENVKVLEVEIPLEKTYCKDDLKVDIKSGRLSIVEAATGRAILKGDLKGKVVCSDCSWSLLPPEFSARYPGQRIMLYLEKAIGFDDIWASVFDSEYMKANNISDFYRKELD